MDWDLKRAPGCADAWFVIELHRLHGNGTFLVNADLVETIEACPDTTITLVNKHRYVVQDTVAEVVDEIVAFRARIAGAIDAQGDHAAGARMMPVITDQEQAA